MKGNNVPATFFFLLSPGKWLPATLWSYIAPAQPLQKPPLSSLFWSASKNTATCTGQVFVYGADLVLRRFGAAG